MLRLAAGVLIAGVVTVAAYFGSQNGKPHEGNFEGTIGMVSIGVELPSPKFDNLADAQRWFEQQCARPKPSRTLRNVCDSYLNGVTFTVTIDARTGTATVSR